MYSGTTLTSQSGRILGTHQKINRIAYKKLRRSMSTKHFPDLKLIQHFEGNNGPDAIKRKSPHKDEQNHFCDPNDPCDTNLEEQISGHYSSLVEHLKHGNIEKAAFEASWLAHAIVDGLTPAHHFPYQEHVQELYSSQQRPQFLKVTSKFLFIGDSLTDTLVKNWRFWGAKGLMASHTLFEWGVGMIAVLMPHNKQPVSLLELQKFGSHTTIEAYRSALGKVAELNMFDEFYGRGWTVELARKANQELLPAIVETVSLFWAKALHESGLAGKVYA